MAAIDRLYVNHYYEFDDFIKWCIIYYPKLLLSVYDWHLTYDEFEKRRNAWVKLTRKRIIQDYARLGKYKTKKQAIQNVIKHYKETADYDCPYDQAKEEVEYCVEEYNKPNSELYWEYEAPIANFSFDDDLILKWHCPLPFVREYLQKQCGVNPKWEWFYKLFWKGKKLFK